MMVTIGAGQIVTQDDIDSIRAASDLRPTCRLVASGAQSLTDNTSTAITFTGTDTIDTHGFHDPGGANPTRITPTVAGIYRFTGSLIMATGNTDYTNVSAFIRLNNTTNLAAAGREGNVVTSAARVVDLTECFQEMNGTTDYIELHVIQDNTANAARNTNQSGQFSCTLEAEFVRLPD